MQHWGADQCSPTLINSNKLFPGLQMALRKRLYTTVNSIKDHGLRTGKWRPEVKNNHTGSSNCIHSCLIVTGKRLMGDFFVVVFLRAVGQLKPLWRTAGEPCVQGKPGTIILFGFFFQLHHLLSLTKLKWISWLKSCSVMSESKAH